MVAVLSAPGNARRTTPAPAMLANKKARRKPHFECFHNGKILIVICFNILEAINTDLKTKLRVHNGMSKRYRKLFIDEF